MKFNVFGNENNPRIILIHGVLTPWQIFTSHAEEFSDKYCVIVPALDGHDGSGEEFSSISLQAEKIENFCIERFGEEVFAVCGLSLGGAIAHRIWANGRLRVRNIVMDGAPLIAAGSLSLSMMKKNYISILRGSKARERKTLENFKKHFLPEKFLPDYLSFIDSMSEKTISDIVDSVFSGVFCKDIKSNAKALYIHGTGINELYSKKSAKLMAKHYPEASIVCFKGDMHCETAIYRPEKWCAVVRDFCEK